MTRTEMRSIAATMQVLAAIRGDIPSPAGLTFDELLDADRTGPRDTMNRRIVRPRPFEIAAGRTTRYPRCRPQAAFARG